MQPRGRRALMQVTGHVSASLRHKSHGWPVLAIQQRHFVPEPERAGKTFAGWAPAALPGRFGEGALRLTADLTAVKVDHCQRPIAIASISGERDPGVGIAPGMFLPFFACLSNERGTVETGKS
jgi:hypothetical protein